MPSSTRLLADRLAASATKHLAEQGFSVNTRVVELRPLARSIADAMTTRLRQHRAGGGVRDGRLGRRAGRGDAGVQRQLRRAVQVVLRRAARGVADRHAGADRRDGRYRAALARPRACPAPAVLAPAGLSSRPPASTPPPTTSAARPTARSTGGTLEDRVERAGADFARLLSTCGQRVRRSAFDEEAALMERLLTGRPSPLFFDLRS